MSTSSLDITLSRVLANVASESSHLQQGSKEGQVFEREVFRALEGIYPWQHCVGPDHFDMALDLVGKSGTHYEFDGAFLSHDTLYVIEAKKVALLARQHVGIFVHKLVDILLASREYLTDVAIKTVLVSAGPRVSTAARLHAAAWGVLIVSPQFPTPLEALANLQSCVDSSAVADLRADCEQLAQQLWRPFDRLVYQPHPDSIIYHIATDCILEKDTCQQLIESWQESVVRIPSGLSSKF